MSKALHFLQITAKQQYCPFFTVLKPQKLHPKISRKCSYRFRLNFTNIEAAIGGKSSRERFWKNSSQCQDILLQVKQVIASFRCYENADAVATLIITNFHLYLVQLWWQFFFVAIFCIVLKDTIAKHCGDRTSQFYIFFFLHSVSLWSTYRPTAS